jgi:hypothetical protein
MLQQTCNKRSKYFIVIIAESPDRNQYQKYFLGVKAAGA